MKMILNWLNIYRNSRNLRLYTTEVLASQRFLLTSGSRRKADKWTVQLYFGLIFFKMVHFAYLFTVTPPLSDFQRMLHFDGTLLFQTTSSVNFLLFVMSALTLLCLYQLYWFDFFTSKLLDQKCAQVKQLLRLLLLVEMVFFSDKKKKTISIFLNFKTSDFFDENFYQVNQINLPQLHVINFFIDVYIGIIISKFIFLLIFSSLIKIYF